MEQDQIDLADDDDGDSGWPLGLLPVSARLSAASSSSVMMLPSCTPTSTSSASSSDSDSDADSESATSFFPESTTLGSLIGIHSSAQLALPQNTSAEERHEGRSSRHSKLCSFLNCRGGFHEDSLEPSPSPSLSQYWDMERRESSHTSVREEVVQQRHLEDDSEVHAVHNDVSFHNESWPHSESCGPSLRMILQQHSPLAPWSDFNKLTHHHSTRSDRRRLHSFWVSCCGKLSSNLTA
ncbi:hypothetical protein L7F22_009037 [Adiantum nelumboides]|nr:hypothetical protein [Adiantum nelumboides]